MLLSVVEDTVVDANMDGFGEALYSDQTTGHFLDMSIWRHSVSPGDEVRAIFDFDITSVPETISHATLEIIANGGTWGDVRALVVVYAGNGLSEPSDFEVSGYDAGVITFDGRRIHRTTFGIYSLDVTLAIQELLRNGAPFAGIRVQSIEGQRQVSIAGAERGSQWPQPRLWIAVP